MSRAKKLVEKALSGKKEKQQISQEELGELLAVERNVIDEANEQAVVALKERVDAAKRVAAAKWLAGVPNFSAAREEQIRLKARELGSKHGVNEDDAEALVMLMLSIARKEQDELREELEK